MAGDSLRVLNDRKDETMAQTPPIPDGQSLDATRKAAGQVVTLAGAQVVAVQAAAATLGLPATDFDLGKPAAHSMVVAYDLTKTDPGAVAALRERAPGQILFERATCRSAPRQMRRLDDGTAGHGPADDRPIQAIAAEIVHATPEQDEGDGNTPPDLDESLRRFVGAVTAAGTRDRDGGWPGGSASTSPTPARYPAAASSEPTHR